MRLIICAVGKMKAGPERDLAARYVERANVLGRGLGLYPLDIVEVGESRARRLKTRQDDEAKALLAAAGDAAILVLDEKAPSMTSNDFCARIRASRDKSTPALAFLIGGADGLGDAVKEKAMFSFSFGHLTWPHQLVRILLAEQIYRATAILAGHPYHRL